MTDEICIRCGEPLGMDPVERLPDQTAQHAVEQLCIELLRTHTTSAVVKGWP